MASYDYSECVLITVQPGRKRNKDETASQLKSYFTMAATPDAKTKIAAERTKTGIKDTFQLVFLEGLFASYKNLRGYRAKQSALETAAAELPENTINPVWRIKGRGLHSYTCAVLML